VLASPNQVLVDGRVLASALLKVGDVLPLRRDMRSDPVNPVIGGTVRGLPGTSKGRIRRALGIYGSYETLKSLVDTRGRGALTIERHSSSMNPKKARNSGPKQLLNLFGGDANGARPQARSSSLAACQSALSEGDRVSNGSGLPPPRVAPAT